jgi:hypothetical protein
LLSGSYLNSSASFNTQINNNSSSINLLSGSYLNSSASFDTQISNNSSSISLLSGSYLNSSASFSTQINDNSSSIDLLSGSYLNSSSSFDSRIDVIESNYVTTGSNTFIGNQEIQGNIYVNNTSNALGFSTTSSLYTDGGLRVTKDAYISGSTFIAGNLTVYGTSSIEFITSSTLIGLEFINLNTDTPSLRYAGINVFDSGSVGASGSLLYDSQNNQWLFVHAESGSADVDSSILLFGPLATNNFGSEPLLQPNRILKTQSTNNHGHHVTQSAIIDNGSLVSIDYSVNVTGSLNATSLTGSLDGSNIVNSSISNAKLANSTISGIALGSNLNDLTVDNSSLQLNSGTTYNGGTAKTVSIKSSGVTNDMLAGSIANNKLTNSTISGKALGTNLDTLTIGTGLSGTSYNGSSAITIANTGVTAFNTRTGGVSLQASDISGLAAGIVSGSSQVVGSSITTNTVTFNGTSVALGGSGTITAANPNALTIGTGLSGTSYSGASAVTIANTGVTSNVAGTGITVSGATGAVTITNSGVTSIVAGTNISISGGTGAVTITNGVTNNNQLTNGAGYITSSGTAAAVSNTVAAGSSVELVRGNMADNDQFRILVGGDSNAGFVEIATADDGTEPILVRQYTGVFTTLTRTANLLDGSGNTTFPGDVTAYSSDERLKENIQNIPDALDKVLSLNGVTFDWKQEAFDAGFNPKIKEGDAGVLAQQVQAVLPQAVKPAPFDLNVDGNSISGKNYLTVQYEKLAPLFIEAIKNQQTLIYSQQSQIDELKTLVNQLLNK